jgi:HAMP domain-containing protein
MAPSDVRPGQGHRPDRPSRRRRRDDRRDPEEHRLEERLRSLRDALRAATLGDFSVRMPDGETDHDPFAEVALAFNSLIEQNQSLAAELDRVSRSVGGDGKITDRASVAPAGGAWAGACSSVNSLLSSVSAPTIEAMRILEQVAAGDLSDEMPAHLDGRPLAGEFGRLASTVNTVVGRLRTVS